jgi:maleylpyruvate isomerase
VTALPDPARDAADTADATAELLAAVAGLDAAALAAPSLLPGWSRGHVLAHLARNADSMVNLLTWARTGTETPQYGPGDARDRDIEADAGRPLAEHLEDLRASADRLAAAIADMPPAAWAAQVAMRSGRVIAAATIPYKRLVEVRLHHVDLGIGYRCADLPAAFAARELDEVAERLAGHEGVAAVRLRDTATGRERITGAAAEPELTVSGDTAALLAWVTGRGTGEDLTADPRQPLPALPPL